MNVACPECGSVFRVDPARVPAGGVRARCSVCGGVMKVETPHVHAEDGWGAVGRSTPAGAWPPAPSLAPTPTPAVPATPVVPIAPIATSAPASTVAPTPPRSPAYPSPPGRGPSGTPSGTPIPPVPPVPVAPSAPGVSDLPSRTTPPVAHDAPVAPVGGERPPINPFLANDPNQKAKRLARALVSDIVAYHPQMREQGLQEGTLRQLFRDEIKKSYEEYVEQVGKDFADSTAHFQDALNDILAGGRKLF